MQPGCELLPAKAAPPAVRDRGKEPRFGCPTQHPDLPVLGLAWPGGCPVSRAASKQQAHHIPSALVNFAHPGENPPSESMHPGTRPLQCCHDDAAKHIPQRPIVHERVRLCQHRLPQSIRPGFPNICMNRKKIVDQAKTGVREPGSCNASAFKKM